jgi:small subunit ribosomal protein S4
MHGPKGSRRKTSEYATALAEKQKLRFQYGVLERQFRRYFQTALTRRGVTGEILLQLLETRLDNVVFVSASPPPGALPGKWFHTAMSR